MAAAKMAGLVVTPTLPLASMREASLPLVRRGRDRSSSHTERPAEASFWIWLGVSLAPQPTAGRRRFRLGSAGQKPRQTTPGERAVTSSLDELAGGVGDSLCRDAVLLV